MGSQAIPPTGQGSDVAAAMDSIRRIVRVLRLSSRATEKSLGISGAQLFVLQRLVAISPDGGAAPSIADLAAQTATDPSSVSVVVSRLVSRGLVSRRPSKVDGRRTEVLITPAGRTLVENIPPPIQERLLAALAALPAARRTELVAGLEAVVTALGLEEGAAPMFFEDDAEPPSSKRTKAKNEPATSSGR